MPELILTIFHYLFKGVGIMLMLFTILPISRQQVWWIRVFDFPRIQITVATLLYLIIFIALDFDSTYGDYLYISLLSGSVIFQLMQIVPYTFFYKLQVLNANEAIKAESTISFLVTNVYMDNRDSKSCLQRILVADPDVILAVETDKWWQKEMDILKENYPHTIAAPLGNTYGMLLYSKLPLENAQVKYLLQHDIPSVHTNIILPDGTKIKFFGIHPRPPVPGESTSSLKRDAELVVVGREAKQASLPVIVAGDLNDVAWSHTTHLFQRVSGLLDPRIGRGMFSTFNAKKLFLRWPLDHIFFSREFRVAKIARLPFTGSDHFPIYLKLAYEPGKQYEQEEPEADKEDLLEATSMIQEGYKK